MQSHRGIARKLPLVAAVLGPFDAYLLQRGLRTMPLRVDRQSATALELAQALERHPAVTVVHYPVLPSDPGHEIARRQMDKFGGLLSFEVRGDFATTRQVVESLRLCTYAASLGDVHTLVMHPAAGWWRQPYHPREADHVPENLVRISVGIEDARDVIVDVLQALEAVAR